MDVIEEIFAALGGPTAIARETGIKVQTVCDWRKKAPIGIPEWRRGSVLSAAQRKGIRLSPDALAYLAEPQAAAA